MAAVAQSARVSATRDGLPVGQSQLRAPDQALGERTNKCSRARVPHSVSRREEAPTGALPPHPLPGSPRRRSEPLPGPPGHGAAPADAPPTFPPRLRAPGRWGLPVLPLARLPPLCTRSVQHPLNYAPQKTPRPILYYFFCWGRGSRQVGGVPEGLQHRLDYRFRFHLDIISQRGCPRDDYAGRSCAQDDAARSGPELPAQRVPARR